MLVVIGIGGLTDAASLVVNRVRVEIAISNLLPGIGAERLDF